MSATNLSINNTQDSQQQVVSLLQLRLIVAIPSTIIFILGLMANISTVVGVVKDRKTITKDLMFYLVANLALYDITVLLIALPVTVIRKLTFTWPFGSFLCNVINGFPIFAGVGEVLTTLAIAIDRYHVVLQAANPCPKELKKGLLLIAIFIASVVFSSPALILSRYDPLPLTGPLCDIQFSTDRATQILGWQIYVAITAVLVLVIPVIIEVTIYISILLFLRKRLQSPTVRFTTHFVKAESNIIKLMLLMSAVYIITHLPLFICYFIYRFQGIGPENIMLFQLIFLIAHLSYYSKAVFNPIIYAGLVPRHKQWLLLLITFKRKCYIKSKGGNLHLGRGTIALAAKREQSGEARSVFQKK